MKAFFDRTFDRIICVIVAFLFCQFPQLVQQYELRLAGHVAEASRQMLLLENSAKLGGKTLDEYIRKFLSQQDVDFVHQGEVMQNIQDRYLDLTKALTSLESSKVWAKPFLFFYHIHSEIFQETLQTFTFGLSVTLESAIYALIGVIIGALLYRGIRDLFRRFCNLFRKKEPETRPQ